MLKYKFVSSDTDGELFSLFPLGWTLICRFDWSMKSNKCVSPDFSEAPTLLALSYSDAVNQIHGLVGSEEYQLDTVKCK